MTDDGGSRFRGFDPAGTSLVVGVDDRPLSLAALSTAADLALRLGADLHVVHAIDLRDYPNDPDSDNWDTHATTALTHLDADVRATLDTHPGPWTYHAWQGTPVHLLQTVADETDALMIVVGHHPHWTPARLTRESVGHALTRTTHRPILLVPTPKP
jgi:nucleotide-binding universal stress UspA family protein